ncbi:MAG: transporter substrate-binding domain-containing protein [Lachnospiraceae bacterium]|nr:transporter substrate-binding domain-containing protein [Lachnospiraceae bacterium]
MMLKKRLCLLMVLILSLAVMTACGSKDEKKDDEKKELKVGMEIGYPPFEYYDEDGTTPIGIDVEIAYAIGEELGMDIELVNTEWDGIFAGLAKNDYDVVISACTITADRLLDFDFSTPYIENWQCIVTLKDAEYKPTSADELAGYKICYQDETASDTFITEYYKDKDKKPEEYGYVEVIDCFNELKLGRVDAVVCDSTVADIYVAQGEFEITWNQKNEAGAEAEQFGVCLNKGDKELLDKINKALDNMKKSGKLDEILDKYY